MPLRALRSTTAHVARSASGALGEHEVDAHAAVLVEVAAAVVPVGVETVVGVALAEHVDEAPLAQAADGVALGAGDVRGTLERLGGPHVAVFGGDVEVAEDGDVVGGLRGGVEPVVWRYHSATGSAMAPRWCTVSTIRTCPRAASART